MTRMQDALNARASGNVVDVSKVLARSPADAGSGAKPASDPGSQFKAQGG
jgi:hypothetical protein